MNQLCHGCLNKYVDMENEPLWDLLDGEFTHPECKTCENWFIAPIPSFELGISPSPLTGNRISRVSRLIQRKITNSVKKATQKLEWEMFNSLKL